jgi:Protein of unknown function (DUF2971)
MIDALYHYTSKEVLKKIIEGNSLLVGNVKYMNDSTEYRLTRDPLYNYLIEYKASCSPGTIGNYIYGKLVSELELDRILHIYAFCMTTDGDLLSQWVRYGSDALGYSIGFDLGDVYEEFKDSSILDKVSYMDRDGAERSARSSIKTSLDVIEQMKDLVINIETTAQIDLICESALNSIENIIAYYKHEGFREEKEQRLVLKKDYVLDQIRRGYTETINKGDIPTQRIRIHPKSGKLPIARIYTGSLVSADDFDDVERFLILNGYDSVKLIRSTIPYQK